MLGMFTGQGLGTYEGAYAGSGEGADFVGIDTTGMDDIDKATLAYSVKKSGVPNYVEPPSSWLQISALAQKYSGVLLVAGAGLVLVMMAKRR